MLHIIPAISRADSFTVNEANTDDYIRKKFVRVFNFPQQKFTYSWHSSSVISRQKMFVKHKEITSQDTLTVAY